MLFHMMNAVGPKAPSGWVFSEEVLPRFVFNFLSRNFLSLCNTPAEITERWREHYQNTLNHSSVRFSFLSIVMGTSVRLVVLASVTFLNSISVSSVDS